jgi:hypothetical protein
MNFCFDIYLLLHLTPTMVSVAKETKQMWVAYILNFTLCWSASWIVYNNQLNALFILGLLN